jgi:SAM-dependent methyltransferase
MPWIVTRCAVCGGKEFQEVERFALGTYVGCRECGLVLMNPTPTDAELSRYYGENYWESRRVTSAIAKQASFTRYLVEFINSNAPEGFLRSVPSVLEVGSSFGVTLRELGQANKKLGGSAALYAIEPSQHAIRAGGSNYGGVQFLGSAVEEPSQGFPHLGLVILSHVIEHFRDPVAWLRPIAEALDPTSLVYIEVPNYYGHPSVDYAHNYCFTETSLRNTLGVAGLAVTVLDLLHHDRDFPQYVTCLARKSAGPGANSSPFTLTREPLDEVVQKRQAARRAHTRYLFRKHPALWLRRMLPAQLRRVKQLIG